MNISYTLYLKYYIPPGRLYDAGAEVPGEAARPVTKWEGALLSSECRAQGVLLSKACPCHG